MLLLSALLYNATKQISPTTTQIKRRFIENLELERLTKEQQNAELYKDPEYLSHLMMCSSPFLFVEMFGYAFFKVPPKRRAFAAEAILSKTDFKRIYEKKDYSWLKGHIERDPDKHELFGAYFKLWSYILSELAESGPFRDELLNASSRPSFLHGTQTRKRIIDRMLELDGQINRKGSLDKPWSAPFDEYGSVSGAIKLFSE